MSLKTVQEYFEQWDLEKRIMEFPVSSATVQDAAKAIGCNENEIAKTMSFTMDNKVILIVMAGDAKIDNAKYKAKFQTKAVMVKGDNVEEIVDHPVGGVCPFGINQHITVYLDESLKRFDYVYPACGSPNSAIKLSLGELEIYSNYSEWIDVCKGWE